MVYPRVLSLQLVTSQRQEVKASAPTTLHGLPVEEPQVAQAAPASDDDAQDDDKCGSMVPSGDEQDNDWLVREETAEKVSAPKYPSVLSCRCTALPQDIFAEALLLEPPNMHGRSAEA